MAQTKNQVGSPMSTATPVDTDLLLPDLHIEGFRGIKDLLISRLGRVTLLAGKNGAGKTTVLEAVRVYAGRGRFADLYGLLRSRDETAVRVDDDVERGPLELNWEALFNGRVLTTDSLISIGPADGDPVKIEIGLAETQLDFHSTGSQFPGPLLEIRVSFQGAQQEFSSDADVRRSRQRSMFEQRELPPQAQCESLGPGLPSSTQLAGFWDTVALTEEESQAVEALNIIYRGRVERVAMVGDSNRATRSLGRKPVVKLCDQASPVPLKSLGDGAVRMFSVALALANSKDGFLLIDEAENGIHHSIQRDFWTMILKAAHQNNVQVIATTHSWDCVAGFATAATEIEEVDGALIRLDRYDDHIRAVEYTEDDLRIAAEQGIEVR